jgi:hypothetical protein
MVYKIFLSPYGMLFFGSTIGSYYGPINSYRSNSTNKDCLFMNSVGLRWPRLEAPQSRAELAPKPISGKNAETQKISATSFDGNFNNLLSL